MSTRSGNIKLDVPSLLNSLGKSLYRERSVALRELLQNGHDAIVFMRRSLPTLAKANFRGEMNVTLDVPTGTLSVRDDGIGMSDQELETEFSTVGLSPKPELLNKLIESRGGFGERIIGQYGIGFLAAFLVADRVDVYTKKAGEQAYHWYCKGDATYYIEPCALAFDHGTEVIIHLKTGQDVPADFRSVEGIKKLVIHYGSLLQVPVPVKGNETRGLRNQ